MAGIHFVKQVATFALLGLLWFGLFALPVSASEMRDGIYSIDYTVKKAEDDSVSMANDYFEKPARVEMKSGQITVELTMNHSEWITEFKAPAGSGYADAPVIRSDSSQDKRTVSFDVASLSEPILSKIHVTVPSIDYDHDYTIRFVFDTGKMKLLQETKKQPSKPESEQSVAAQSSAANKPATTDVVNKSNQQNNESSTGTTPKSSNNSSSNNVNKTSGDTSKKESKPTLQDSPSAEKSEDAQTSVSTRSEEGEDLKNEASEADVKETPESSPSKDGTVKEETNTDASVTEEDASEDVKSGQTGEAISSNVDSSAQNNLTANSSTTASDTKEIAASEQIPMTSSQSASNQSGIYVAAIVFAAFAIGGAGWVIRRKKISKK